MYRKYTKLKNIGLFSFSSYLQSVFSFLISVLVAKAVGVAEFGLFAFCLVIMNITATIVQFGMERTLVKDLVQRGDAANLTVSSIYLKAIIGSLLAVALLLFYLAGVFPNNGSSVVVIGLLGGICQAFSLQAWFDFSGRMLLSVKLHLYGRIMYFICSLIVLFYANASAIVFLILILLVMSRLLVLFFEWRVFLREVEGLSFRESVPDIKVLLEANIFVWLAVIGNLMMSQVNQLTLQQSDGFDSLGVYAFGFQVIMVVRLFQTQLLRLVTPRIAQATVQDNAKSEFLKHLLMGFCSTLVLVIPIYFVLPPAIRLFMPSSFEGSISVINILLVWVVIGSIGSVVSQYGFSLKMQRSYFVLSMIFGLISLPLTVYLADRFAEIGAALSLILCHGASIAIMTLLVRNRVNTL